MLLEPLINASPATLPMAMLPLPLVLLKSAETPSAVFSEPVLLVSAALPTAVFPEPVLLASAETPTAVLTEPGGGAAERADAHSGILGRQVEAGSRARRPCWPGRARCSGQPLWPCWPGGARQPW